jgi:fructose-bisphosphate aldolase, class I
LEGVGVAVGENRPVHRELIVTTPELADSLSGIILADDTMRQKLADGRSFPDELADMGVLAGVKIDTGAQPLADARARRSPKASTA